MTETYSKLTTSVDPRPMYNGGERTRSIDTIVVHHNATTNKNVALNTWTVEAGNWTSAHYEITDSEIIGAVGENFIAYHAGGTGNGDAPKISDHNGRSIGLEHVNSSGAPSWEVSDATLRNSAKLIADIANRYNLPINRNTIKLHREITSTACPGGLDIDKLVRYAQEAAGQKVTNSSTSNTAKVVKTSNVARSSIDVFKENDLAFGAYKSFRVDKIKYIYGEWQIINNNLASGSSGDVPSWYYNGIPLRLLDNVTRGSENTQIGDMVKFSSGYDHGSIDEIDYPTNGVGVKYDENTFIWFNADAFLNDI